MSREEEIIQLELQHANTALAEAGLLVQNSFYNGAVSRMYYACYHATSALLLTKNIAPKTHKGTLTELNKHFVLYGNFDESQSEFYGNLLQQRMKSDYNSIISITKEKAEQLMLSAKEYIDYITSLLPAP